MSTGRHIARTLPEAGMGATGEQSYPHAPCLGGKIGRIEAIRQALTLADYEDVEASDLDLVVAPWFASAVDCWGKRDAYAARINVQRGHFSEMCNGKRPVALRHLIPLHESAEAVRALVSPLCAHAGLEPPQIRKRITREEVLELALEVFLSSPQLLKTLLREAQDRKGASAEEVTAALKGAK